MKNDYITIAIPKGRLQTQVSEYFWEHDINVSEQSRKLDYYDNENRLRFLFVKNSDVPVYVNYGVAMLGICGSDIVYESGFEFLKLTTLPFGSTRICVAGHEKDKEIYFNSGLSGNFVNEIKVATKFTKFSKDYFDKKNIPTQIIKLTGSIELAPMLGLSDFIVDLVETGATLRENNLSVIEEIGKTQVQIIANFSLYKINYKQVDAFLRKFQSTPS